MDPKYLENGQVFRLSDKDPEYRFIIESERKRLQDGIKIDVEMQ